MYIYLNRILLFLFESCKFSNNQTYIVAIYTIITKLWNHMVMPYKKKELDQGFTCVWILTTYRLGTTKVRKRQYTINFVCKEHQIKIKFVIGIIKIKFNTMIGKRIDK